MAFFDTTWYCNFGDGVTTGYYAVAKRPQNAAVAAGQIVRPFTTPGVGAERVYICRTAGTTANTTDATWTTTRGAAVSDGTVIWQECTGSAAVNGDQANTLTWAQMKALGTPTQGVIIQNNSGTSYQCCTLTGTLGAAEPAFSDTAGTSTVESGGTAGWRSLGPVSNFTGGQAPHARLANALASTWFASGNTVYVGDNHAETQASSITLAPSSALLAKILCHNHSGSYPPTASDITTGASLTVGGSFVVSFTGQGSFYIYGIIFQSGANIPGIGASAVGQTQNWYYFDNCSWRVSSTASMQIGATSTAWGIVVFNNTTVKFAGAVGFIFPYFVKFIWQNTNPILTGDSTVPTTLFQINTGSGRFSEIILRNLDLSQLTGSLFSNASNSSIGSLIVQDCKLNAAMTVTRPINSGMNIQFIRSDSAATAYKSTRVAYEGTETTETSIVRTDGAVDPTGQAQARKIVTTANAQWLRPFKCEPMAIYNETTGSPITVTICGTVNSGALPNNDDVWAEFEYLSSATDPLGTIVTTTKASVLASNAAVAADLSSWSTTVVKLDSETKSSQITLSNGDLTATHSTVSSDAGVRNIDFWSTGKFYFEIATVVFQSTDWLGILLSTATYAEFIGNATKGFGVQGTGPIYSNGVSASKDIGDLYPGGQVACFAVDLTANLGWIRRNGGDWNNTVGADPATGVGGIAIMEGSFSPFFGCFTGSGQVVTFNFGATAYAYSVPSGFANWLPNWTPFKLSTTITPQLPGYIHARVRVGKVSATYYIDPKVTLT